MPEEAGGLRAGSDPSVLVRVVHVAARHRDTERSQAVLHTDRVAVGGEDVRQALVHLRGLVGAAADQDDALLAESSLHRRPVDETGLHLLLHPHLLDAGLRMIGADALLRHARRRADAIDVEDAIAVAVPAGIPLHATDPARSLRAAHHAAGAMHGRVERL